MNVLDVPESTLREVFDIVLSRWPSEITPGNKTFHINGGCNMRRLNESHGEVEEWVNASEFDGIVDHIVGSVEHYLFATIHDALKNLTKLSKGDIDYDAFVSRFSSHPNYRVVDNY